MVQDDLKNIYQFLINIVRSEGLATLYTGWTIATVVAQIGLEDEQGWIKSSVAPLSNMVYLESQRG